MSRERVVLLALVLAALARVAGALSTWPHDWRAEDWLMLRDAGAGVWPLETAHLTVPRDALFWLCARLDLGPWAPRAAALLAHVTAALVLLPRAARRLGLERSDARLAGLLVLALPATFDPLAWPCTCAYALLEACLVGLAWAHLAALDGAPRARAASVVLTSLALSTWELGVAAPALVLALSWARGRPWGAVARDVLPHAGVTLAWVLVKVALASTHVLEPRDPVRIAGNVAYTPLLLLSPWPLEHHLLASAPGALLAVAALALIGLALWRTRDRVGVVLAGLPWLVLLPLLPGPGPESRYLLVAAPWAALLLVRARLLAPLAVVVWCACAATTSVRAALRWREADREARALVAHIVAEARARGARQVVVVDAPDRLRGWGPTWKVSVWRHGLEARLAREGLTLVGQAHRPPGDPERLGYLRSTPALTDADVEALARARGAVVVRYALE